MTGHDERVARAMAEHEEKRGAFASLSIVGYRRLWFAGTFAFMSVQMQFLLRGVLAWDLTEREGALGLIYLCFGTTMLFATPLGGVASDRIANRKVLLVSQTVLFAGALGMGIVVVTGVVQFWMLAVASVAQGLAFGFYGPARIAFAAKLVGADHLGNAITLSMLSLNGTRVFAPAFAGMLAGIAFFGIGGAYLVSAVFSAVALVQLMRCPDGAPMQQRERTNPFVDIRDGVRYVAEFPALRRLLVSSFFVIMFGFNYIAFIPALVKDTFDLTDGYVGVIMSASAIGAVAVAVSIARHADGPRAFHLMIVSAGVFGGAVMVLGLAPTFVAACVVTIFIGAGATGYQSLSNTLALGLSDEEHRGRVQSLLMLSFAGFGIAALPLGLLAEAIGLRPAIVLMGVVAMVAGVLFFVLDRRSIESLATPARPLRA
ncbi:MAG: MFS transporter [Ilumatobacter sp.]|uniref:MFS transporter n=1 Tax=Ilumatobacter sp. TaxID=1967498 RepID=UPI003C7163AA